MLNGTSAAACLGANDMLLVKVDRSSYIAEHSEGIQACRVIAMSDSGWLSSPLKGTLDAR